MIAIPLIVVQLFMARIFEGNHWQRVQNTMTGALAGEIAMIMKLRDIDDTLAREAAQKVRINLSVHETLNRPRRNSNDAREVGNLAEHIQNRAGMNANIFIDRGRRLLFVDVPKDGQIITFATSLHRVYSTSSEVFLVWLVASIIIVGILIAPFIWIHTHSIRRIAAAANRFGRGLDAPGFVPSGSREVRDAAHALLTMKERLNRSHKTRIDMLNAVSHDLKTPLARMRLAVETGDADPKKLMRDIDRLSEMVNGYLSFARGEAPEIEQQISLSSMLVRIARDESNNKTVITNFPDTPRPFYARPTPLVSAFTNIINNAGIHAKSVIEITEIDGGDYVEVIIDDDGKGIPKDKRNEALRPFVRLDESRSADTGGTGLGLSIAQTAIENHGGEIMLEDSPLGGLRVRVVLPI